MSRTKSAQARSNSRAKSRPSLAENEHKFRLLVEGARDYAMFLLDCENRILYWSRGAEQLFGWRANEALGLNAAMIFTPEDRAAGEVEREIETAIRTGSAADRRWHIRKNGSRFWADGRLMLVNSDATDGECRLAKIARDATEELAAREALKKAHDELEARVQERTAELLAANAELQNEMSQRKQLEREILNISEREQRRIGDDLHDRLCQDLAAAAFFLQTTARSLAGKNSSAASVLAEAAQIVNANVGVARDLARGLHPVELRAGGLMSALREMAARVNGNIICTFSCPKPVQIRNENLALNLYRIAQEAVANAVRHSGANRITISLKRDRNRISLTVKDNGNGLRRKTKDGKGMGLHIMNYRANVAGGSLSVKSSAKEGTSITCLTLIKTVDLESTNSSRWDMVSSGKPDGTTTP